MNELLYKEEVFQLIGFCTEIHGELGRGYDEIIYKDAFAVELRRAGIPFSREQVMKSATRESSCRILITPTSSSGRRFSLKPKPSKN